MSLSIAMELQNPRQPLIQRGSRSQELVFGNLNYHLPARTKLLKPLFRMDHPKIHKFWMYSSNKILLIYKNTNIFHGSDQLLLKITQKSNDTFIDTSNILELPKTFTEVSALNFLRFEFRNQTKKNLFLAGGPFLLMIEIQQNPNDQNLLRLVELGKSQETPPITCLASCREEREEGFCLLSGDNLGKVRLWRFSGENELIDNRDFQRIESKQPQPITSLSFNKKLDKVVAGNSISEWRVWGFPGANELKSSRLHSTSDENVYLQFCDKNEDVLFAAIERGSFFEIDLTNDLTREIRDRRSLTQDRNSSRRRIDDFKINTLSTSHRKNFLILWSTETHVDDSFKHNFMFFSDSRKLIEEKIIIENEICVDVSTYNNTFAYATEEYVQVYKLNEDFRIPIQSRSITEIKNTLIMPDNSFWIGSSRQIFHGIYSRKENRPIFTSIDHQENQQSLSSLAFCQSKNRLAASYEQKIKIWSISNTIQDGLTYQILGIVRINDIDLKNIVFDHDGQILIFAGSDKIGYFSMQNLIEPLILYYVGAPLTKIRSLLYYQSQSSPTKKMIIFSGSRNSEHVIILWCLYDLTKPYRYLQTHTTKITSMALFNETGMLFSGDFDGRLVIWDLNDENVGFFEKEIKIQNMKILSLAVSNDNKKVATVCADFQNKFFIKMWNLDTGLLEKTWDLREGVRTIQFGQNDKFFIVTNIMNLEFIKIKDYFYKSAFQVLKDILDEKLGLQESIQKYPQIFNETLLKEIFLHYENKSHFQTILHINAYLFNQKLENYYDQCLRICEAFRITPKFSLDINGNTPLDFISKDLLVRSLKLIIRHQFPLSFCPSIKIKVLQSLARFDPVLLMQVLENRFCEPYGFSNQLLPEFEGPLLYTYDRIFPNDYIINFVDGELKNEANENRILRKNFEIRILDIPNVLNPNDAVIQSNIATIESSHPFYGRREFEAILDIKWNSYAAKKFFRKGFIFLLYVVVLTIYSVFILPQRLYSNSLEEAILKEAQGLNEKYHIISLIFDSFLLGFLFYFLYSEFSEVSRRGNQYWKDMWNYFDLLNMGFLISSLIMDLLSIFNVIAYYDYHILKALFAMTLFLAWLRLVTYSRGFKGLGFMVRLLIQVFIDMKNFLFLMFFITLSITVAGFMLQDYNKFDILQTFNSFYRLIIGDFSGFDDLSDNGIGWLLWIFFFIGTLSLQITMLNLLISIISSTFQKVADNNVIANNFEKALIVAEIDETLSKTEKETLKLKKYLCVVYSKENNMTEQNENEEVLMRMDRVEEKIEEIRMILKQNQNR